MISETRGAGARGEENSQSSVRASGREMTLGQTKDRGDRQRVSGGRIPGSQGLQGPGVAIGGLLFGGNGRALNPVEPKEYGIRGEDFEDPSDQECAQPQVRWRHLRGAAG